MTSQPTISTSRLLLRVVILFALWRGALFAFDFAGMAMTVERTNNHNKDYVAFPDSPFLDGWFRWDSGWYMRIAENGYSRSGGQGTVAFFPLYPYLARFLGHVVGGHFLAGFIISNLCTLFALFFIGRIGMSIGDPERTWRALVLLLIFPTSFFLSAYYSEGLFLLTAAAATWFFMQKQYVWAGIAGMFAMMTRSTGMVLFLAFCGAIALDVFFKRDRLRWSMLWLLLIPAGLLVFMALLQAQVADPWAFLTVQSAWGRGRMLPLLTPFVELWNVDFSFPHRNAGNMQIFMDALVAIGLLAIGVMMAVRRFPAVLWLLVLGWTLMPLSTGKVMTMGRYAAVMFPAFFLLSDLAQDRRVEAFMVFAFGFFLALYNLNFLNWYWAG